MKRDEDTYGGIRRKYDEFLQIQSEKPVLQRVLAAPRPFQPETRTRPDMGRIVFTAIGVGIGAVLLALAAFSFYVAAKWGGYALNGAATGYTIVGFFLALAGLGGIAATLNHNFRVLGRAGHGE